MKCHGTRSIYSDFSHHCVQIRVNNLLGINIYKVTKNKDKKSCPWRDRCSWQFSRLIPTDLHSTENGWIAMNTIHWWRPHSMDLKLVFPWLVRKRLTRKMCLIRGLKNWNTEEKVMGKPRTLGTIYSTSMCKIWN